MSLSHLCFQAGYQPTFARRSSLIVTIAMLSAFAVSPRVHAEVSVPAAISDVYSDVDMRVQLATTKDVSAPCAGEECALNKEFNQQVQDIGARLSKVAFEAYPDLSKRIGRFEFVVAEKMEPGTTSNAAGTIVIFRGVQGLYLEDKALAFVIAREMGRVIGRHHDENTGTRILLSVLVGVLFPAANIFHGINGAAGVANATSSATFTTTAASSATSFFGSKMVLAGIKPKQLREADVIAMRLLKPLEWSGSDIASSLEACTQIDGEDAWAKDFRFSTAHVRTLAPEEEIMTASAEPKVELSHSQAAQHTKPVPDAGQGNTPVTVALAPKSGTVAVNKPEGKAYLEAPIVVAKNEAGVSPDTVIASVKTEVPKAKLQEQEVLVEDQSNDTLEEEPQSSVAINHPLAKNMTKPSMRSATTKVPAWRAGQKRNNSQMAFRKTSKTASKVASRYTNLRLAKAPVSNKQGTANKKLYANKSSNVKLARNDTHKSGGITVLSSVKSVGVNSGLRKITQARAPQVKIE